jgi:hypothetical protein
MAEGKVLEDNSLYSQVIDIIEVEFRVSSNPSRRSKRRLCYSSNLGIRVIPENQHRHNSAVLDRR